MIRVQSADGDGGQLVAVESNEQAAQGVKPNVRVGEVDRAVAVEMGEEQCKSARRRGIEDVLDDDDGAARRPCQRCIHLEQGMERPLRRRNT